MDRAERTGLGLALIGHAALLAALSVSLLSPDMPESAGGAEGMEVELVDAGAAGLEMPAAADALPSGEDAPAPAADAAPPPPSAEQIAAQQEAAAARAREAAEAQAAQQAAADAAKRAALATELAKRAKSDAAAKEAARKAEADAKLAKQRAEAARAAQAKAEAARKAREAAQKAAALKAAQQKAAADKAAREAAARKAAADKVAKEKAAREARGKGTGLKEIKLGGDRNPSSGAGGGAGGGISAAQAQVIVDTSLATAIQPRFRRCAPTGVDTELIITRIKIDLNRDGSVANVAVLGQTGINDSNSPQADLLKSCAIKAVRTAAPFTSLPAQHYDLWKSMTKRLKTK